MPNKYVQVGARGTQIATFVHHTGRTTLPERPPDLARGEVVLCLHGEGGNGHVFRGRAGRRRAGSIEAMADFTWDLAARLGLRPAVLLGHSMGALVALQCALDAPDRVRALVLCAPGASLAYSDADLEQAVRVSEGKQRRPFDAGLYAPGASPDLMRAGFFEDMKTDPRARLGDLRACRDWRGLDRIASLRVASLLLEGEFERAAARSGADAVAARLPGARHERIAGSGPMLPLEAPAALAAAVTGFLGELT